MTLRVAVGHGTAAVAANIPPNTPTISTGTPAETGVTLFSSAFSDPDGGTHVASRWQVTLSTDTAYDSPVIDTGQTATYLLSYNATGLTAQTNYIARVAHRDSDGGWSDYSTNASFQTAEAPAPVGAATIDIILTRTSAGSGVGLVSSGIPLPPGILFLGQEDRVQVIAQTRVGKNPTSEQEIYVESLSGRHSDGSVRSILIQFNNDLDFGQNKTGTVYAGEGVSRTTTDITKTAVTSYIPEIACTPTDPDYLISCELILPVIKVTDTPASPQYFPDYESKFVTYSDLQWASMGAGTTADEAIVYNYYDRALFWFIWWIRTGTYEYWRRGILQAGVYGDFIDPGGVWGNCQAPRNQMLEGLEIHYLLTGLDTSRDTIITHAGYMNFYWGPRLDGDPSNQYLEGRISARTLMSFILAYRLGDTSESWDTIAGTAVTDIISMQSANGAYDQYVVWNYDHSPYMTGLVHFAFIYYYTRISADSAIPASIKKAMDYEWSTCFIPATKTFLYLDSSSPGSTGELNGVILPAASWYYAYSGDSTYLTRADTILDGMVNEGWYDTLIASAKALNQMHRQSAHHLYYRLGSL